MILNSYTWLVVQHDSWLPVSPHGESHVLCMRWRRRINTLLHSLGNDIPSVLSCSNHYIQINGPFNVLEPQDGVLGTNLEIVIQLRGAVHNICSRNKYMICLVFVEHPEYGFIIIIKPRVSVPTSTSPNTSVSFYLCLDTSYRH